MNLLRVIAVIVCGTFFLLFATLMLNEQNYGQQHHEWLTRGDRETVNR